MFVRSRRYQLVRRVSVGAAALLIFLAVGTSEVLAHSNPNAGSAASPALRAQARKLYEPLRTYERSTTPAERARSRSAAGHVGKKIDACQAPYLKQLTETLTKQGRKLSTLWNSATLLETYQADVKPVARQLTTLANSWAALSLRNPPMNKFAHAIAAELRATLNAAPFDSCRFVKALAAHHFSYAWAKTSSYGVRATRWSHEIGQAGDRVEPFWRFVNSATVQIIPGAPPGAGANLFTPAQLTLLGNIAGEAG